MRGTSRCNSKREGAGPCASASAPPLQTGQEGPQPPVVWWVGPLQGRPVAAWAPLQRFSHVPANKPRPLHCYSSTNLRKIQRGQERAQRNLRAFWDSMLLLYNAGGVTIPPPGQRSLDQTPPNQECHHPGGSRSPVPAACRIERAWQKGAEHS